MTTVTKKVHFAFRNRHKTVAKGPKPPAVKGRIPRVSKLMALAIRFDRMLDDGVVASQSDLARLMHITQPRMTQIMNLLHLAPDIQEEILYMPRVTKGRDPVTERDLRPIAKMVDWGKQRDVWGSI